MNETQERVASLGQIEPYGLMAYGKNIERARRKLGLNQAKFGHALGKSGSTISGWETDAYDPSPADFVQISEMTGMSLDELIRGFEPQAEAAGLSPDETSILAVVRALGVDVNTAIRAITSAARPAARQSSDGDRGSRPGEPYRAPESDASGRKSG